MKYVVVLVIVGVLGIGVSADVAFKVDDTNDLPNVSLTVDFTRFGKSLDPGESNYALPEVSAANSVGIKSTQGGGVVLRCFNSSTSNWTLQVAGIPFQHQQNPSVTIPISKFKYMVTSAGFWNGVQSQWVSTVSEISVARGQFLVVPTSLSTVYAASGSTESPDLNHVTLGSKGTEVEMIFGVDVPSNQLAGVYTSSVQFNMVMQ